MIKRPPVELDRRTLLSIAAALPVVGSDVASANDRALAQPAGFDELVHATMRDQQIPGMTIGYGRREALWIQGYGFADLENNVPATPLSAYRYASVQKPMTAVAVLQQVELGRIELDADIRQYVPYFPRKAYPITIRQLLGHIGGIVDYSANPAEEHLKQAMTTRQAIDVFADHDLVAEPGTRFHYTSYGYNLLAAAVETAAGVPFGDYLLDRVWRPAGMTSARMDDPLAIIPHRVRGYQFVGGQVRNSEFVDVSSRVGGGASRGTVPDLIRFALALADGRLLKSSSVELMTTPTRTRDGKVAGFPRTDGYAMGWSVVGDASDRVLFHDGGQTETRTMLILHPGSRLAIASAQNFERDTHPPLAFALWQKLTGRPGPTKVA